MPSIKIPQQLNVIVKLNNYCEKLLIIKKFDHNLKEHIRKKIRQVGDGEKATRGKAKSEKRT